MQAIEGQDIRLLNAGLVNVVTEEDDTGTAESEPILMARLGKRNDVHGQSIELSELLQTSALGTTSVFSRGRNKASGWSEWDMP